MDFTSTHYCQISRVLLTCVGQWPHQSPLTGRLLMYATVVLLASGICTQVIKLATSSDDMDTVIEGFPLFITALVSTTKYLTLIINHKMVKRFQDQINEDWRNMKIKEEIEIMKKYVAQGKQYAIGYMAYIYMTASIFGCQILEPYVMDIIAPLNDSRPLKMIYPAEYYFFEAKEYFFPVTFHMLIATGIAITILIASDTMFMMYIQYVCGLLAVMGRRFEHTLYNMNIVSTDEERRKYKLYITDCVRTHCNVLKFVDFTESIFSVSYLVQLGLNVVCMSVTLLEVVVLLGKLEVVKFIMYAVGQLFHLYCVAYQGQKLISHSTELSDRIYNGVWYNMPIQSQKMLLLVLNRTSRPCYLTAGKVFVFSMANFSTVVQNCMSYFMVLASFR